MTFVELENSLGASLPFWRHLTETEKEHLVAASELVKYQPRVLIHHCTDAKSPGIQIVMRGRARVFISSPDGKQLTLHRIEDYMLLPIGVSCVLANTICDLSLETETHCEVLLIPRAICKKLFDENLRVKTATIDILASRFMRTMRILEAVAFTGTRNRVANSLIEQSFLTGSSALHVTHANIAADLGSTREVVTRILNQFQADGLVTLRQKAIQIDDKQALIDIRGEYLSGISDLLYPKPNLRNAGARSAGEPAVASPA